MGLLGGAVGAIGGAIGGLLGGGGGGMTGDQQQQMQQAQQQEQQNLAFQRQMDQMTQHFSTLSKAEESMHQAIMQMLNAIK